MGQGIGDVDGKLDGIDDMEHQDVGSLDHTLGMDYFHNYPSY